MNEEIQKKSKTKYNRKCRNTNMNSCMKKYIPERVNAEIHSQLGECRYIDRNALMQKYIPKRVNADIQTQIRECWNVESNA